MQRVIIPGTDLSVSRFIFGTGSLFSAGGSRARRKLLSAAYANGFTHFDTAPSYGFGLAEQDLSELLTDHPEATVTTKVGIYSPGGESQSQLAVLLRKAGGHLLSAFSRATVDWSVARARQSLDGSLRRLGRGHIDFFALHEPDLSVIQTDEWLRWLEDEVTSGRIRYYGVAGNASDLKPWLEDENPLFKIIQANDSLDNREADGLRLISKSFQITYGYVSSALRKSHANVPDVLSRALNCNRHGAIVVSTRKIRRLSQYEGVLDHGLLEDTKDSRAA
jgi:D-threo-aldose 1-dehydrogenase